MFLAEHSISGICEYVGCHCAADIAAEMQIIIMYNGIDLFEFGISTVQCTTWEDPLPSLRVVAASFSSRGGMLGSRIHVCTHSPTNDLFPPPPSRMHTGTHTHITACVLSHSRFTNRSPGMSPSTQTLVCAAVRRKVLALLCRRCVRVVASVRHGHHRAGRLRDGVERFVVLILVKKLKSLPKV